MNGKKDVPEKQTRLSMTKDQIETLITCVETRRALWDPTHEDYKCSRAVKEKLWFEIGKIMKLDGAKCCNKWKNLAKEFRFESRSKPKPKSGDAASTHKTKFQYYDRMLFLSNAQLPKETYGNLEQLFTDTSKDALEDDDYDLMADVEGLSTSSAKNIYSTAEDPLPSEIIKVQEKMGTHDELTYYFLSMVPRLSQLSEVQTILFRGELVDIVMKYAYKSFLKQ